MNAVSEQYRNSLIGRETELTDELAAKFIAHWEGLRHERIAPKRSEVDPLELFEFLPKISMIKSVGGGADFEFSLIGTQLASLYGLVTRQRVSAAEMPTATRNALQEALGLCVSNKAPVRGLWARLKTTKKREADVEAVLLPISEDGEEVSRVLGYHAITY